MLKKLLVLTVALLTLIPVDFADAAKKKKAKKPSGIAVTQADISSVEISYSLPNSKKKKKKMIACFGKLAGATSKKKNQLLFTSFSKQKANINAKIKKASSSSKKKKLGAQLALTKILEKAAKNKCSEPDYLSLAKYTGPWGETQVRRLLSVFANGGSESWVQGYLQMGMQATVNDLATLKSDPYIGQLEYELSCDQNPDDNTRKCYPDMAGSDENDYYLDGYISFLNLRSIYTKNPVHDVLAQFVLDERGPGDPRVLGGCNLRYFKEYINYVDRFASSGNYRQFVLDTISDQFIHSKWLSGDVNHPGSHSGTGVGNEDYARELLELITLGTVDKFGAPNYTDLDVFNLSLILSGLDETNNNGWCTVGYHPELASPGAHTVFAGTPYQITINSGGNFTYAGPDFATALLAVKKKQVAYELARRMWPRFINSMGTPAAIQKLADLIEENDLQLWPVMRRMMESKAFYAPQSAKTIIKTPFTLFVTYARQLGIPIEDYNSIRWWLDDIGMLIGRPPTVFGFSYHLKELAADAYQEFRFKSLFAYTMWQNFTEIEQEYGWTPYNGLIAPMPRTGDTGLDIVNMLIKRLNLDQSVTSAQRDQYAQFLNYYIGGCPNGQDPECFPNEGSMVKLYRDAPDPGDTDSSFYRTRLLAVMLGTLDAFGVM